jgi:hypothetical protein
MSDEFYRVSSGISREYRRAFILDEDSLRRIEAKLLKAKNELHEETRIVFHIKREDDRFYETFTIEDVFQDPNLPTKRVSYVSVELRRRRDATDATPWRGDWIAKVAYTRERKFSGFRDFNEIEVDIATPDRQWALLLADEIDPQVERTLKSRLRSKWFFFVVLFLLLSTLPALVRRLAGDKVTEILSMKTISDGVVLGAGLIVVMILLLKIEPFTPRWLVYLLGHDSTFLWGEELKLYPTREQLRRNVFWVVFVGFFVSLAASLITLAL